LPLRNHCLGNLLLVSEIYRDAPADETAAPGHKAVIDGIHRFARMVGAGWKTVWPVSTRQGELKFLYSSGVVVTGEHKSSVSLRGFPVDRLWTEYIGGARVDPRILKAVARADIIIIAPGSVYSSLVPILQVKEIADAVRRNRRAIKVLGANFWVQKGETDITIRDLEKEFFVSDLIEAYNKNVAGGTAGLFKQVVTTNLKNFPAEVIQNYALEGKVPIYLDKNRVEKLGFEPLAVEVHSLERLEKGKIFQHDPERFARTIRALVFLKRFLNRSSVGPALARRGRGSQTEIPGAARTLLLNEYMAAVEKKLDAMTIPSARLRRLLTEIIWRNRDIRSEHLRFLRGIRVVPRDRWQRSTIWDRILAYYDPDDSFLNLRRDLLEGDETRLEEDLLIGLGESLLGNYTARKSVRPLRQAGVTLGKVFEIALRPEEELRAFLSPGKIREYLELTRLQAAPKRPGIYSRVINNNEFFTPPGLLFGLLYAWYLNNGFGCLIEYEMSLLKIATSDLIPKPSANKERRQSLIDFFRRDVFRH